PLGHVRARAGRFRGRRHGRPGGPDLVWRGGRVSIPPPDRPYAATEPVNPRTSGPGRLIIALYTVFVVGSLSRAGFQSATRWEDAPLAYSLSAFAGLVCVVAAVSLAIRGRRAWWVSLVAISTEMVGVLAVGLWSVLDPGAFPDATVWSGFEIGRAHV